MPTRRLYPTIGSEDGSKPAFDAFLCHAILSKKRYAQGFHSKYGGEGVYGRKCRNVRLGSQADIGETAGNVRFTPESGHWPVAS